MYDLIIIGGGPGGYIAAEKAGALGKTVLLAEEAELGGTCLNHGCIPTKSLLYSSKLMAETKKMEQFGVSVRDPVFNIRKAMEYKNKVRDTLRRGVGYRMKKHKVTVVYGNAKFLDPKRIQVKDTVYEADHVIIATGSVPAMPPIPGIRQPFVKTSRQILEMEELPTNPVIIGAGYIGMEFACFFNNLGIKTEVVEMLPDIIPFMDSDLAAILKQSLENVTFHLESKVESIGKNDITFQEQGAKKKIITDMVLVAAGRQPNLDFADGNRLNIDMTSKGVRVEESMATNLPNVYAIGDVTGISNLAHSASRMGEVAVNNIFDGKDRMRTHAIPWVVYTSPEISGCGLTEREAERRGEKIKTARLTFKVNARHFTEHGEENGLCKAIIDAKSDTLLGMHMAGTGSSEIIFGAAAIIEAELRVKDVEEIIFPHPTVSEMIKETIQTK